MNEREKMSQETQRAEKAPYVASGLMSEKKVPYTERAITVVTDFFRKYFRKNNFLESETATATDGKRERAKDLFGFTPKYLQATERYQEMMGGHEPTADISSDIQAAAEALLKAAMDQQQNHGSDGEQNSSGIAMAAMEGLVEKDVKSLEVQEYLQNIVGGGKDSGKAEKGSSSSLPQEITDQLEEEAQQSVDTMMAQKKQGKPFDLDALSRAAQETFEDHIDSLPPNIRDALKTHAIASLQQIESGEEGEQTDDAEAKGNESDKKETTLGKLKRKSQERKAESAYNKNLEDLQGEPDPDSLSKVERLKKKMTDLVVGVEKPEPINVFREMEQDVVPFERIKKNTDTYRENQREVVKGMNRLEDDLRAIFVRRKGASSQGGYNTGKRIHLETRIQEKARGIPPGESRAWKRETLPTEQDYAIKVLFDLSDSVKGEPIEKILQAVIATSEPLTRLSVNNSIDGFNTKLYNYKNFGKKLDEETRSALGGIIEERKGGTDLGWAIHCAAEDIKTQKEKVKTIIVISDWDDTVSSQHQGVEYDLDSVLDKIETETDIKIIPVVLGPLIGKVRQRFGDNVVGINMVENPKNPHDSFYDGTMADFPKILPKVMRKIIGD